MVPLRMPDTAALQVSFELEHIDYSAPEANGRDGGVSAGEPLWTMSLELQNMSERDSDEWRAWVLRQRGRKRMFFGYEVGREFPRAFSNGFGGVARAIGGAFGGLATSWSEAINAQDESVLTLSGLPAAMSLSVGDYVGFRWDDSMMVPGNGHRRAVVRVVEDAIASAGGVIAVKCEPPVPRVVPVGAVAHLDNPACLMRLQGDTALSPAGLGFTGAGGRIVARQDLRA